MCNLKEQIPLYNNTRNRIEGVNLSKAFLSPNQKPNNLIQTQLDVYLTQEQPAYFTCILQI